MISLGVTLDIVNPDYYLTVIRLFTRHENKEIDLIPLADIRLLEDILQFGEERNYDRVIFYDMDELDVWMISWNWRKCVNNTIWNSVF